MGRHAAGKLDEDSLTADDAADPESPARQPWTLRRKTLAVLGSIAVGIAVLGVENIALGGGAKPTSRPPGRVAAAQAEFGAPVGVTSTLAAQIPPSSPKPSPSHRATPRPAAPVTHAPVQQAPLGSNLAQLSINTELTGSEAAAWADAALSALGAPTTGANVQTMMDWFANEGTPHDLNNPLNLQTPFGGSYGSTADNSPASADIQAYPTPQDFVGAFPREMNNGSYSAIVAGLKSGAGLEGSAANSDIASELSVYSGGGYDTIPASGH
jgi:hypothetical protein